MTQDLNTEIKIGADASGVETGVAGAKKALASLGQAADQVGRTGGEGLKKIGAGGEDSARRLDSATKNMVASLQRQIAAAEAGGTANRQYQESIARLRGADVNALKPYLDQLDAARDKAEKAARANAGLEGSMGSLSGAASLARSALTAMVGSITIGAFVGFVRGINDGIDALNDIKDATGSSIENISALEDVAKRTGHSMDSVTSTLVKFNQVLSEAKPGSAQEQALKAIGLSAKELRDLDPAEALLKTAQALTQFEDDANKARLVQELFGKSIREVAPFLNDLAEKGRLVAKVSTEQADEAAKFNKQLSEMEANAQVAARALVGPMITSMNELIAKFKEGREAGRSFWSIQSENYWNWVDDSWSSAGNFLFGSDKPAPAPFVPAGPGGGGGRGSVNPPVARPSVGDRPDEAAIKAAQEAARKAAEAHKKELQEQAKLMAELSGLTSSFAEDWNRLTAIYQAGGMSLAQYTKAQADLLAKQPGIKAAADAEAKAREAINKANLEAAQSHERYIASLLSGTDKIRADATAQEEATRRMGLSKEAVAELDSAKLEMLATDLELQAIKQMDRNMDEQAYTALKAQAEAYRELASAKRAGASKEQWMDAQKASDDAAKKVTEEWKRSAEKIEDSLTDALMRGFESGKDFAENLRDTVSNMFRTLVLRPIISAAMSPVAGAVNGMLYGNAPAAAGGGANALGMIGSGANLINGLQGTQGVLGTVGGWLGMNTVAANTALASSIGIDAASAAAAANAASAAGSGFMSTIGAAMPWIAGAAAIMSIVSSLDDSGTYHTGGAAQYSGARGLRTSLGFRDNEEGLPSYNPNDNIDNQFGTGFGYVERGDQTISAVSAIAQGLGTALDGVAVAFGEKAGYAVATAFADDTSGDGAWGALRISKDGQELLNWQDTRTSRWAPKEFGDGEAGYKEYLAAVAKDTRQVLLDMDLPSWADKMLESIGDSASMDQLTGVLNQIGVVQSAFVALGNSMDMFANLSGEMQSGLLAAAGSIDALAAGAGAFFQGFYSEQERMDSQSKQLQEALGKLDLSIDPSLGDDAKDQFRAAVEAAFAAGDAELAAALLSLSGTFANAADYFEQAADAQAQAAKESADAQIKAAQDAARAIAEAYESAMERIGSTRFDLENQLLTQVGQGDLVQQRVDQRDLADLTQGLPEEQAAKVREQFEANLKLRDQYEANQLAADNLAKAMEEMERQQNAAAQAQRSMLQSTVQSAQNAVSQLKSIFDMLDSSIASLRGSVASAAEQDSRAAREYIAQASVLMRSGSVVDAGRLQAAVRSATAGIDNQQFANSTEADFERLKLAGELAGLKDSTAGQLTVAEQHLSIAESQLAALEYIASSISSLAGAQQAAAGQPRDQWATVSGQQVYASSGGAVGLNNGSDIDIYGKDGSRFTGGEAIAYVRNQIAANDEASVYAEAVRTGISSKALDELMGWQAGTSSAWAELNKLPKFEGGGWHAGGLRVVGERGWEVEATGPARYWNQQQLANAMNGGGSAALEEEVRAMRAELAQLRAATQAVAEAAGATADVLVRVTNNGNGMVTAAAPL